MKPANNTYRPQLDGVRAICIIFTVANHVPGKPWWVNGNVGVDIFFALSGWLITTLLIEERRRSGRIDLGAFYIRRIFRIAPLYFFTIGLYGAAALAASVMSNTSDWSDFRHALLWLATFNSEYRPVDAGNIFGQAWTLGIEEKFYLLWPAIFIISNAKTGRAFLCAALASALLIAIAAEPMYLVRGYAGLGFGTLAAVLLPRHTNVMAMVISPLFAWLSLAVMTVAYVGSTLAPSPVWNLSISLGGAALVAFLWHRGDEPLARMMSVRPLAWVGRLTYAIYLIHMLVLHVTDKVLGKIGLDKNALFQFLSGYGVAIVVAAILHMILEKPLIAVGRRLTLTSTRKPSHGVQTL